jgi:hypothetical protein
MDSPTADPAKRLTDEIVPDGDDRSDFRRDRDIILYSSAFKRLSGITQVASAETGHAFHTRLTHISQVAQLGRALSELENRFTARFSKPGLYGSEPGLGPPCVRFSNTPGRTVSANRNIQRSGKTINRKLSLLNF